MGKEPTIHDKLYVQPDQFKVSTRFRIKWTNKTTGEVHYGRWVNSTQFLRVKKWMEYGIFLKENCTNEIEFEQ
jgi:hypothetical protein